MTNGPPDAIFAGDTLVRLKKARGYLKDPKRGLESVEAEKLTEPPWCPPIRLELEGILQSVASFIDEVRVVLRDQNDIT